MSRNVSLRLLLKMILIGVGATVASAGEPSGHRSPVDLAISSDGTRIVTVNQTSHSVSLLDSQAGTILDELVVGGLPQAICRLPDRPRFLVTCRDSGLLHLIDVKDNSLAHAGSIPVGFHPVGVAVEPAGKLAFVTQNANAQIAVIDLDQQRVTDRWPTGQWPRYLAITPDGQRLAVGTSGDRGMTVMDATNGQQLYQERFVGLNIGHLQMARDGQKVWFPWVVYRQNPINVRNIQIGWVLATRLGRVRMDGSARREALSLDPQGKAIGDPHGLALTSDEKKVVVSAAGTHELLVYRAPDLPFMDYGGTDHIPPELLKDPDRFVRIELGGRPLGLRISADDQTVYVANYLNDSVQVIDLQRNQLRAEFPLASVEEPSLVRRGEAIFYDARRSLDQWYSCHTCHFEGGGNSVAMDTWNDESPFTPKTVLPLDVSLATSPWTWHGWQTDFREAMKKSITSTLQGKEPSEQDVDALIAYLKSLQPPPNPFRPDQEEKKLAVQRGQKLFQGAANCHSCHSGPMFTDGEIHDVGTAGSRDRLEGYNTPSLIGVYRKVALLHDGRASSLEELLKGPHRPSLVSGADDLSEEQVRDLVAYLKTL